MRQLKLFLDSRGGAPEDEFEGIIDGIFSDRAGDMQIVHDLIMKEDVCIGKYFRITSPEDMNRAMQIEISPTDKYLFFDTGEWRIIPLENVIAQYQSKGVEVIASASSMEDFNLLREVLEVGVDGVVLSPELLDANLEYFKNREFEEKVSLVELQVKSIETTGSGDRVCVDTTSLLRNGEGLLLGATSSVFVLVEAEVNESGYVSARPFRVNAGPVSAYVLDGEKTRYLSELKAGSEVMVVSSNGSVRRELVGRVKIERRPFVLIRIGLVDSEEESPILLQNAETVRLVTPEGSKSVTELKVGDIVLGRVLKSGRHFGISIEEFIEER